MSPPQTSQVSSQSTERAELEELADRWLYLAQHPAEEPLHDYHRSMYDLLLACLNAASVRGRKEET